MKKWIIIETVFLTIVPSLLLIYAIPALSMGIVEIFSPMPGDAAPLIQRLTRMLPYTGGLWGLWSIWQYAILLANNKMFSLGWKFFIALIGGAVATWDLIRTTNATLATMVCIPTFFLVGHLLVLRSRNLKTVSVGLP
jgi:uncharacterized membrane protein (GlpM family)